MHGLKAILLFLGTLLTATGYGATFLLADHFRALGGSELHVGQVLGGAVAGTLVGVPLVGWLGGRIGGARLAAAGAALVAMGYAALASLVALSFLIVAAGFLVGLGWGIFYLAAPMAVSERVEDRDRAFWFMRFGVFQMAGIGGGPVLAMLLSGNLGLSTAFIFRLLAAGCCVAAVSLWLFEVVAPARRGTSSQSANWIAALPSLLRTRALYPIAMVGLGAAVFTGVMTFQSSLVREHGLEAGVYFAVYAVVVVVARFALASTLAKADPDKTSVFLLCLMTAGVLAMFGVGGGVAVQAASALLLGLGYGLAYSIIQTQAVNDAPEPLRNAALTWFVISYFAGIFGFPAIGSWVLVNAGTSAFLGLALLCAVSELAIALVRRRNRASKRG